MIYVFSFIAIPLLCQYISFLYTIYPSFSHKITGINIFAQKIKKKKTPETHTHAQKARGKEKGGKPPQQNQTLSASPLLPAPLPLPLLIRGGTLKLRDSLPRYASLAPYNSELQSLTIIPKFLIFWDFFMNFYAQDWFDLASQGLHISLGFWGYREGAELVGAFVMAGAKADADAETGDAGGGAAGGGVGGSFSEQRLVEKLNKLNSSAASIQSILFSVVTFLHARKSRSLGVAVRFIFF